MSWKLTDKKVLTACKLTRIDAKIGVLIIHQNTSVFSIISQHLVMNEKIFMYKLKSKRNQTLILNWTLAVQFWSPGVCFSPHIVKVGFSDAPSCDENCRTTWGHNKNTHTHKCTPTLLLYPIGTDHRLWFIFIEVSPQDSRSNKDM